MIGKIHSIQSLGTLDGPGIRFVVFLQGCPLRCKCCHNPDTWNLSEGKETTAEELVKKALRYGEYFGSEGGITLSGGEPLMQSEFAEKIFSLAKKEGINTCLDTSGFSLSNGVKKLLQKTDRVLLDIKYTTEEKYFQNVGCDFGEVIKFLDYLNEKNIKTTLRQVIIPTQNDNEENILKLKKIAEAHPCVDKIELLPFKKICQTKYDILKTDFPFKDIPTPTAEKMKELNNLLK